MVTKTKVRHELSMKFGSNDVVLRVYCECGKQMSTFYHDSKSFAFFVCADCDREHKVAIRPAKTSQCRSYR